MRRFLGFFFLLIGLAALASDYGATNGPRGVIDLRPAGLYWHTIHKDSLLLAQPAVARHLSPAVWDNAIQPILETPLAPMVIGLGLFFLIWAWRASRARLRRLDWAR